MNSLSFIYQNSIIRGLSTEITAWIIVYCILKPGKFRRFWIGSFLPLGDTLADFGFLCVYWTGPEDKSPTFSSSSATTEEGFINRQDLIEAYQKALWEKPE